MEKAMNSDIMAISMLNNQSEMNESEKNDEIIQPILYQFDLIQPKSNKIDLIQPKLNQIDLIQTEKNQFD